MKKGEREKYEEGLADRQTDYAGKTEAKWEGIL